MPMGIVEPPMERGLRLPEVIRRVGMSRAWVYDAINAGRFPRPVKIGARASIWLESEITEFLATRTRERDASLPHGGRGS